MILTRITRKRVEFTLDARDPDGVPVTVTAAEIALLPFDDGPSAGTAWTEVPVVAGEAAFTVAGPDAAPGDAVPIPEMGRDLWARPAGATDVDPVFLERIAVRA